MQVEIKDNTVELPFPKLMISEGGSLVFFENPECGFRLDNKQHYARNWNMAYFIDFEGEVTLKNK